MSDFRLGVKAAVPTALGYVAIGLAFGVVAAASGPSASMEHTLQMYVEQEVQAVPRPF